MANVLRSLTLAALLLTTLALRAEPQGLPSILREQLARRLGEIADAVDGSVGYVVIDLSSGERVDRQAAQTFPTASSIKPAILYELFKQSEEGRLNLDRTVQWDSTQAVGGSGVLFELSNPVLSLHDLAVLMIVLSDNTATNVLIDTVGMDRVNARLQSLGLGDIRLRRKMMDVDAVRKGRENLATPAALAALYSAIHEGKGLSKTSRDAMLAILEKGKSSPMLRGIAPGVAVASKPGDLDGVRADGGIVYLEGRPYVFVAMTSWLQNDADGERAIEELSRAAYQYFDRVARSSEYGRKIR
jgi:beta-lactamase class A